MVRKIQTLQVKDIWPLEANFTNWLYDNIEVLNERLGLSLTSTEREKSAGSYSADLVAEDEDGRWVVVENQFGKSDHDHMGKIIAYVALLGAKSAIWIAENPRPEHLKAVSWLNERGDASFYLVKLEAIQIGDSQPAPLLTLVAGPSEAATQVGSAKKEMAEIHLLRKRFWTGLLEHAKQKTNLHADCSPRTDNHISTSAGLPKGFSLTYYVREFDSDVSLYIDRDKNPGGEGNIAILELLKNSKDKVEEAIQGELEWMNYENVRNCRIAYTIKMGGWKSNEEEWPTAHAEMVDAMIRFEKAMRPHLKQFS